MITEKLLKHGGGVESSVVRDRLKPFEELSAGVKSIVHQARIAIDPSPESLVTKEQLLEKSRAPLIHLLAGVAREVRDLNGQISYNVHSGSRAEVTRIDQLRTNLAIGILVAMANNDVLSGIVKIAVHGDTSRLHAGSANLFDIELPDPDDADGEIAIGSSLAALSYTIRNTTGLNGFTSGKLATRLLERCEFETVTETPDERIIRLGIECRALSFAVSDLTKLTKSPLVKPRDAKHFGYMISELHGLRTEQILEIYKEYASGNYKNLLDISMSSEERYVTFVLRHHNKRDAVTINYPRPIFEKLLRNLPAS